MEKITTAERLNFIMKERQLRQVDILKLSYPFCQKYDVKLNKSDLSQYVSGKVEPSQEKLVILGMALNVTESWLMGFDVPMERTNTNVTKYSKQIGTLLNKAENLNDDGIDRLMEYTDFLLSQEKYQKTKVINQKEVG